MRSFRLSTRFAALLLIITSLSTFAQKSSENQISDSLTAIVNSYTKAGKVNGITLSANPKTHSVTVTANEKLGYMPFRPDNVKRIYNALNKILAHKYAGYSVVCRVENQDIEALIPNFYRKDNADTLRQFTVPLLSQPLVTNASRPYLIQNGLQGRHIALWQSHGRYYDQKQARWAWQRARVFQVVEDLYTQSYVLPYLVPMLENAGANVLLPRERDTQLNEVIVDNDTKDNLSRYREQNDRKKWRTTEGTGFANTKKTYLQGENPFTLGTSRSISTITNTDEASRVEWIPNIPEDGRYAVYVSYKTVENSATDAHYTVFHKGGKTEFTVNQTMDGGTWLFLGYFRFDKGRNNRGKVMLTNLSAEEGKVITADAVKFGGGMGNIARSPNETGSGLDLKNPDSLVVAKNQLKPSTVYEPEISNYPRYTEGARYWLQWAGIPDSIYSRTKGQNDYSDDFQSRGFWVNYLVGGSSVSPGTTGLRVPLDLAMAFHSDAGSTINDSIIGTLGICTIRNTDGKTNFQNGISRWASRDLTDIIQTQVVDDVRKKFAPEWTRRNLWNKSYSESRVPEVPTMLLELLSHQNFADMRYGLDPRFRFTVSRSIYKGMLKYISSANKTDYVVQPLPVDQFSCRFLEQNKVELHWLAVADSLEPTARADQYVLYTRIDDGDFDNGVVVNSNRLTIRIQPGKIYSFKITALNQGGQSFPSEILSVYRAPDEKGEVLIVNGFDRLSAPANFAIDSTYAGFLNNKDAGVPYLSDISFVGRQYEFKRNKPWLNDDAPGFGASHANYETKVIAGNTFDYPYLHGKAIKAAGYSFVSASEKAVICGDMDLNQYKMVDLILGKQKQTFIGNAKKTPEFKSFPLALQHSIQLYCLNGGNLLVSGAFIGSDMCEPEKPNPNDRFFVENILKYKFRTSQASVSGNVKIVNSPIRSFKKGDLCYFDQPNQVSYSVESPDAIEPVGEGCFTICRYAENNLSAAVAYSGIYKTCSFGFPFETLQSEKDRDRLMESILLFFSSTK
ncbi:MAG: xanthan lyase [Bacteroidota bacterium]|nr:xanthan lyase [Bacteroidota bacterium]